MRQIQIVYQTNIEGYYIGQTTAEQSDLNPAEWLIPWGAVQLPPPEFDPATHRARWRDDHWELEAVPQPELPPEPTPIEPEVSPPEEDVVPRVVPMWAMRATFQLTEMKPMRLIAASDDTERSLFEDFEAILPTLPMKQRIMATELWTRGTEFNTNGILDDILRDNLGLTQEEVDGLMVRANSLAL